MKVLIEKMFSHNPNQVCEKDVVEVPEGLTDGKAITHAIMQTTIRFMGCEARYFHVADNGDLRRIYTNA